MTRTIVLVDMDGVLADFDLHFASLWRERFPGRPPFDLMRRTCFRVADELPPEWREDARSIYSVAGFFLDVPPVTGALEAMLEMPHVGLDVWICTSPLTRYNHCVLEKYQWIEQHLGFDWTERVIMTKDKGLVRGDVLIDDHPSLPGREKALWRQIVFDTPYNRHISDLTRMTSWASWRQALIAEGVLQ